MCIWWCESWIINEDVFLALLWSKCVFFCCFFIVCARFRVCKHVCCFMCVVTTVHVCNAPTCMCFQQELNRCCSGWVKYRTTERERRVSLGGYPCLPLSLFLSLRFLDSFSQPNVHVLIIRRLINNSKVTGVFLKISWQLNNRFLWPFSALSLCLCVCVREESSKEKERP